MKLNRYLQRKENGIYYFRIRVPASLRPFLGKNEIKKSLRTTCVTEAVKRALPFVELIIKMANMTDANDLLRQLRDAGIDTDKILNFEIYGMQIGDVKVDKLSVDPAKEGDAEAAALFIQKAAESQERVMKIPEPDPIDDYELSTVIEIYVNEKHQADVWNEKTEAENKQLFDLLIELSPVQMAGELGYKEARSIKEKLLRLPPNINKVNKYSGLTIDEIIELGDKPRSLSTANKILTRYSSFCEWMVKHGYCRDNYFNGLTVRQKNKRAKDERRGYEDEELIKLFNYLTELEEKHTYYYWLPRIALYTGMRLEEICQLHLSDLRQEEGIWVIDINDDDDKKLKNASAKRLVPIHSRLIEMGLISHVDNLIKKKKIRLFTELKKIGGRLSHAPSGWFSRVRRQLGWVNLSPKLDFHSFRHSFATQLQRADLPEYRLAALLGHSVGDSESFKRYGAGATIETMKEDVELITYSCFE